MRQTNRSTRLYTGIYFLVCTVLLPAHAEDTSGATKEDAVKMVRQGIAAIKQQGQQRVYQEISQPDGKYRYQDLYLVVYRLDGLVLAHGASKKMLGKQLIEMQDADGKAFIKERMQLAAKSTSFWHHYKFPNPENRRVEAKTMYCERLSNTVVCGGVYD